LAAVLAALAGLSATPAFSESRQPVRLNELQFIGTHNSYHIAPDQAVFDVMKATGYRESAKWTGAKLEAALSFSHPSITAQLEMGLRVFEFDIHDDPDGGRFASPGFLKALPPDVVAQLDPVDPDGELLAPGFKVFHSVDTDVRSRCLRLTGCLKELRLWSLANPGHMPIFIQIETKEGSRPPIADAYVPAPDAPFDRDSWLRLHEEIRAVFPEDALFTPADLQGAYPSVNAAVRAEGWPVAQKLAGKFIFLLLDDPEPQDAYAALIDAGVAPLLFVARHENDPHTAWLMRPKPDRRRIRPLVEAGFLVYTRADANSAEARRSDYTAAEEALASGAQLISTDYPTPNPAVGPYAVSFRGKYVRCNVILRRDGCNGPS
jgi:hypothetical protein